jgi:hypothetical protein
MMDILETRIDINSQEYKRNCQAMEIVVDIEKESDL